MKIKADPSRPWRLCYCLIGLLLALVMTPSVHATTTTVQDVIYRAELKTDMRWLIGNGKPGRLQELEARVEQHETILQRGIGVGAALGALLTLVHLAIDYLRIGFRR
jgi:hypothetical protein